MHTGQLHHESDATFLNALIAAVPHNIHTVLTYNGMQSVQSFYIARSSQTPGRILGPHTGAAYWDCSLRTFRKPGCRKNLGRSHEFLDSFSRFSSGNRIFAVQKIYCKPRSCVERSPKGWIIHAELVSIAGIKRELAAPGTGRSDSHGSSSTNAAKAKGTTIG